MSTKSILRRGWTRTCQFVEREDGLVPIEWLVIAGVAVIIGVTMTYIATSGMSSTTSGPVTDIQSRVNAAASAP
jgi:hypothetical protein